MCSVSKSTRILLLWSPELYVHYSVLSHAYIYQLYILVYSWDLCQCRLLIGKIVRWYIGVQRKCDDQPDRVVIQRILLLGYSWVGTTPSAEAKLLCCIFWDKSILGVVAFLDCRSWRISAGCWDDTAAFVRSPRDIMIVWWSRGYIFQDLLELCTSAYWWLKMLLLGRYYPPDQRPEQSPHIFWVLSWYGSWVEPYSWSFLSVRNSLGAFTD